MRIQTRAAVAASLTLLLCAFAPQKPVPAAAKAPCGLPILATAAPVYNPLASLASDSGERFPQGAQLLLIDHGKAQPLAPELAATADAQVYYDGMRVLFAGKKQISDPWSIWEVTLADHILTQVASAPTDLVRPFYMPGRRMIYARRAAHGFTIELAAILPDEPVPAVELTHIQAPALPVAVMRDGRVLFEAGFPLGTRLSDGAKPELFLVYADGSGVESYRCDHESVANGRWGGQELASGDTVFTHGNALARFTSPKAVEQPVHAPAAEYAGQIAETQDGQWITSTRKPGGRFTLVLMHPGSPLQQPLFADPARDLVEPVLVCTHPTPKRHPSGLHDWPTANLMALDVRQSRQGDLATVPPTVQLEQQDEHGNPVVMGTAPIESDGSFFVKVRGDRPIRFTLLDPAGKPIRAQHGWFWIRAGEQRICVGCHTGPERASENHVPQVLLHTTTPVDLSGMTTKPTAEAK